MRMQWICSRCLSRINPIGKRQLARFQSNVASSSGTGDVSIYPPLLERARALSADHFKLEQQLSNGYDAKVAKKAGELSVIAVALESWDKANESLSELRSLLRDPSGDAELRSLASQDYEDSVEQLKDASKSLTASLVPKHPFADLPCLVEIRPGVGGSEAGLFAADLLGMYQGYCAQNGLQSTLLKYDNGGGDDGQVVEAIMQIDSIGAYGLLRCEGGVHRVQRVPLTETKGRTHTSTASVMVLPSFPQTEESSLDYNDPSSDFYIDQKDVRKDYMRASGAGGQHVNKTESAVRLTHMPTNTVVAMQDSRSRFDNEKNAWSLLRSRLAQARREKREEEMVKLRRSVIGVARVGRADKIRTYNWSQQRITDHRSGTTVHGIDGILSGGPNLEKIMDSVRKWMTEMEIEDMIVSAQAQSSGKDKR